MKPFTEAGDHEQAVVDADADPDHRHELGGEFGKPDKVGEEQDDGRPQADAEQRRREWQADREHGAEREEQDQCGRKEAHALRAKPGMLDGGDDVAARFDGEPRARGGVNGGDVGLYLASGQVLALFVPANDGPGDGAALGNKRGVIVR